MRRILIALAATLVSACATKYQPNGFSGGFSETQLSENVFQISFRGNGYTSGEQASDFALLRAAEVALQHGYRFFAVVDRSNTSSTSTYTTPTQTYTNVNVTGYGNTAYGYGQSTTYGGQTYYFQKPSSSNMIVCFRTKEDAPQMAFDAAFVSNSIRAKYKLPANK